MYLTAETLEELERRFGVPEKHVAEAAFAAPEFDLLEYCGRKRRAHDVTLLILTPESPPRFALIRKPSYPPDVFRPPSGGIDEGESFEAGALREALEETGLEVRLDRYLLRVDARFTHEDRMCPWTTHVFSASVTGGGLDPQDRHEIAEARWTSAGEIWNLYRPRMLAMGTAGMKYRVFLQDRALQLLGYNGEPAG